MPKTPSYHDYKINFIINCRGKAFGEKYELQNRQYIPQMLRPDLRARYNFDVSEFDRSDFPPHILVNPRWLVITLKIRVYSRELGEAFGWFRQLKNQTTTEQTKKTLLLPPLPRGGWGGLKSKQPTKKLKKHSYSSPYQGGAGGVKISTTNEQTKKNALTPPLSKGGLGGVKILYNNDKTLQQKLRKIQATAASRRNDRSWKATMGTH